MTKVGIEAINVFGGTAVLNVEQLAIHRKLDRTRFDNLLMKEKTVALPNEDPITFAVNAAKPLLQSLSADERARIELLITCTESGIDFGKSVSTYVHHHLGLNRNCRMFELKQACYAGTAGLQMAASFVLGQTSPGAKALVIATDISRFIMAEGGNALTEDWSFAEPSSGAGAIAMLVSEQPSVFELDVGASGYYGYEVMDTCRPFPDGDAGDADLSLLSYLDCCEAAYNEYAARVDGADFRESFSYLVFHTPFGGMVKGAHRTMMRKLFRAPPGDVEDDFVRRVSPGLQFCQRVGNIMSGTVFMALASAIMHGNFEAPRRIGCFSYGSGCCSEFYSGVVRAGGRTLVERMNIGAQLDSRHNLSIAEYEAVLRASAMVKFGTRNVDMSANDDSITRIAQATPGRLVLGGIREFHREYEWA